MLLGAVISTTPVPRMRTAHKLICLLCVSLLLLVCISSSLFNSDSKIAFVLPLTEKQSEESWRDPNFCASKQVTIVSAYFNIGSFKKGPGGVFTAEHYKLWLRAFSFIENPVVFFSDDHVAIKLVQQHRSSKKQLEKCTVARYVKREDLWGYRLVPNITAVINQPGYPKFHPNTAIPEYSAVMHCKFALMQLVIGENPFKTNFFAWMDSGLHRSSSPNGMILLAVPPGLPLDRVAGNQVELKVIERNFKNIFLNEWSWYVGGGLFLAHKNAMWAFCEQYRKFTEYFLRIGYSNTDQQIIYGMYSSELSERNDTAGLQATVKMQRYSPAEAMRFGSWYHLRTLCQVEGERQRLRQQLLKSYESDTNTAAVMSDYFISLERAGEFREKFTKAVGSESSQCSGVDSSVTVVTAYFDLVAMVERIGDEQWEVRLSDHFSNWLNNLAVVRNPVVAYFDSDILLQRFSRMREHLGLLPCTYLKLVDRQNFWSWKLLPWLAKSAQLLKRTDSAEILSALHSKFAVLKRVVQVNPFKSTHFAFLDAGLLHTATGAFSVRKHAPSSSASIGFLPSAIDKDASSDADVDWMCKFGVSTNYFVGSVREMKTLADAYKVATERTLMWNLLKSDHEIIQALYCWQNLTEIVAERLDRPLPRWKPLNFNLTTLLQHLRVETQQSEKLE